MARWVQPTPHAESILIARTPERILLLLLDAFCGLSSAYVAVDMQDSPRPIAALRARCFIDPCMREIEEFRQAT